MMRRQAENQRDHYSKILCDVSDLVLNVIRSPPPSVDFSNQSLVVEKTHLRGRDWLSLQQITPVGFASMVLGISLSLILCGSMTFFLGFILMPWVIALVVILYFVGVVSSISIFWRAIWCPNSVPIFPKKDIPDVGVMFGAKIL